MHNHHHDNQHDGHHDDSQILHAISLLTSELHALREQTKTEFDWFKSHAGLATKQDLKETETKIMSKITDWADQEQADLSSISSTLDTIVAGIAALDALITALQNSQGTLSASDQAALDAIQASSHALVSKSGAISVTPPANTSPTLDAVSGMTVQQDAGLQTVSLTGITSTSGNPINVAATSSDPTIVPNPTVVYTTPASTATLTFTPVSGASGSVTISVRVSDSVANADRTFTVTVTPASSSSRRR